MGNKSNIQWTDATWNIARGCTKVDEDCKFCYMYRESMDSTRYNPLDIVRTKTVFDLPLKLKEPSKIFACSLTDFFHESIDSYREEAWDIIRKCPQHTFQILTKRPHRIPDHLPKDWGDGWENVWLGTSVGSAKGVSRAVDLVCSVVEAMSFNTKIFLSLEPLYEQLDLTTTLFTNENKEVGRLIDAFDWIIVGGESGNEKGKYQYRECKLEWIEKIVHQSVSCGKPVFVKQMGTHLAKQLGLKDRHGADINEFPTHLQIRQFP